MFVVINSLLINTGVDPDDSIGPLGEQGQKGDKGNEGDVGPKGVMGEIGEIGFTGIPGDQGKSYLALVSVDWCQFVLESCRTVLNQPLT